MSSRQAARSTNFQYGWFELEAHFLFPPGAVLPSPKYFPLR